MKAQGTTAMLNRCISALPNWGLATFPAGLILHFGDHQGSVLCQDTRWQLWILKKKKKKNLCLRYQKLLLFLSQGKQVEVRCWSLLLGLPPQIPNTEANKKQVFCTLWRCTNAFTASLDPNQESPGITQPCHCHFQTLLSSELAKPWWALRSLQTFPSISCHHTQRLRGIRFY